MKNACSTALAGFLSVASLFAPARLSAEEAPDLTPLEARLLEQWHSEPEPFPEVTFRNFEEDTWCRAEKVIQMFPGKAPAVPPAQKPSPEQIAIDELTADAQAGNPRAQFALAEIYDAGKLVPRNSSLAFSWWFIAARQGFRAAQHNLGVAYLVGIGVVPNREEAIKWFGKAAELGDSVA